MTDRQVTRPRGGPCHGPRVRGTCRPSLRGTGGLQVPVWYSRKDTCLVINILNEIKFLFGVGWLCHTNTDCTDLVDGAMAPLPV